MLWILLPIREHDSSSKRIETWDQEVDHYNNKALKKKKQQNIPVCSVSVTYIAFAQQSPMNFMVPS